MKKNPNRRVLACLALALALAGCKKEEASPPPSFQPAQAKPATPAAAVQKPVSSARALPAQLDFSRRTDPFKPFAPAVGVVQPKQNAAAPAPPPGDLLPIQSFEVSKFRVAGIIAGLNENRALILDPNGKGYVVAPGMPIGNANGHISRITATSVEVAESFRDEKGRTKKRTVVLTLAKKK